jgi:drug/metabolite transporter (DMT)-like permease
MDMYLVGVLFALTGGVLSNLGVILQKKVINEIPSKDKEKRFFRSLVRRPVWLLGIILSMFAPAIFVIGASLYLGPALLPGLMNAGLIVLAIGSVRINKERLGRSDYSGIILMVVGIFLLGMSMLSIKADTIDWNAQWVLNNSILFTAIVVALWAAFYVLQRGSKNYRAILLILASGFMFSLTNFWVFPLSATIFYVFQGIATLNQWVFFVLSCVLLPLANIIVIVNQQTAFKYGQASTLNTLQQFPTQLTPAFIYLLVFELIPPSEFSLPLLFLGTALVLASSFLLMRRKVEVSEIK